MKSSIVKVVLLGGVITVMFACNAKKAEPEAAVPRHSRVRHRVAGGGPGELQAARARRAGRDRGARAAAADGLLGERQGHSRGVGGDRGSQRDRPW